MQSSGREMWRRRTLMLVVGVLAAGLLGVADARAQADPNQVTGLTVVQGEGYATLSWTPVATATDYQIERTPVDASNVPTGASVITGVWQPIRTVTPGSPRFADAGFALGGRFQWRVRARFGTTNPQAFSEPVFGTTRPQWGTGPGAGPADRLGAERQRDLHDRRPGVGVHRRARRRERPRPRGRARPHEPDRGRHERGPGQPADQHAHHRLPERRSRPRRRSRARRRRSSTATSTATSRRAASRA